MANSDKHIPGPGRAVDGISRVPGRSVTKYVDWTVLKREFLLDPDHTSPRQWLRNVKGWTPKKVLSGNTTAHVAGWGDDKARLQQRKTEAAINAALEEERKRIPKLRMAKLNLVVKIIEDVGRWDRLGSAEKKLCYEILKTELGEPTSIKTVGVVSPRDPVEALLEEYGLMKEGRVVVDAEPGEGRATSQTPAAVDSGSPAQVPQS